MAMNVARDTRVFADARTQLRALIQAGEAGATGLDIFGDQGWHGRWQGHMIKRLRDRGLVVAKTHPDNRRWKLLIATAGLRAVVDDDDSLTELIWPTHQLMLPEFGADPPDDTDPNVEIETIAARVRQRLEEREAPPALSDDEQTTPLPSGDMSLSMNAKLDAIIQIHDVAMQNIVYMREQVDALTKTLNALRKAWE